MARVKGQGSRVAWGRIRGQLACSLRLQLNHSSPPPHAHALECPVPPKYLLSSGVVRDGALSLAPINTHPPLCGFAPCPEFVDFVRGEGEGEGTHLPPGC